MAVAVAVFGVETEIVNRDDSSNRPRTIARQVLETAKFVVLINQVKRTGGARTYFRNYALLNFLPFLVRIGLDTCKRCRVGGAGSHGRMHCIA